MAIEQAGCWLIILERRESRLEKKLSSSSWLWLGGPKEACQKAFFVIEIKFIY